MSEKEYESETGEKALYRKGSSDYHTLRYVKWLQAKSEQQADEIAKLKKRNATLIHEAMVADNDLIALQGDYAHQQVELELAKETLANAIKEIGVQGRLVGTTQAELAAARKELKALKGGKDDNNK